ncbi:magnesium and cobalt transport protein CorA [Catelliglobosispora koreensis]|uniref:magnesium and cobalt transport protein CorA n=1 Tax=Catelliglobosispora koreensis TaxID=129052 RepID=UPI00037668B3|nr:magnesium and cobalt transport protein CorA [Catelliglobosispora koreensis]
MADDNFREEPGRLTRALSAPARAMSRMLSGETERARLNQHVLEHEAIVDCALYLDGVRQNKEILDYREALNAARKQRGAFVWLGLHAPSHAQMKGIAEAFGLHELAVEDVVNAGQRPKIEQFGDLHFIVLRTARYVEHTELTEHSEVIDTGQIMLFVGDDFVISVRHGDACRLRPVRERLERKPDLLKQGPWAVAYGVMDQAVDLYMLAADGIATDVDVLEEAVFARNPKSSGRMQRIYQLKRELVEFKRAVLPLPRPMMTLIADTPEIPKELRKYFRDVQDHLARVTEQITSFDDLLISIMQARLAQVTVDQNNDMRKIASWAAIAAVWTAIAGVYGMNFAIMPELEWKYGYPLVITVMVAISFAVYRGLRRNGWL